MEFYIEDLERSMWHRVVPEEIIMCEEDGRVVRVYRKGRPVISTAISIDGFRLKYLKGLDKFIRTSSEHIVNKDMIHHMVERRGLMYLKLEEDREALIRKGHEYVYFIKTNQKKPDRNAELYKENQSYIDNLINTYSDCNTIKEMVKEKIGVDITTRYIRERYKIIKYS